MKQLRHILSVTLLVVCATFVCAAQNGAQKSSLAFDRQVWDFGVIDEVAGPVSHTFTFTNKGSDAIVLENVAVSCGCTTPEFSKVPIKPGGKGEIKITYDPTDRPGAFIKDIHVTSGKGANRDKITVRGEVNPRPRSIEEDYPYELSGGFRINRFDANFSYVEQAKPTSMTVGYVNASDKPVKFDFAVSPPSPYLKVTALPTICAGCKGEITLTYDFRASGLYGRVNNRVNLWVNGKQQTLGITTNAIVVDKFALEYTDEGPRMKLEPPFVDLGTVGDGEKREFSFVLANEGNRTLIVSAVQPRKNIVCDLRPGMQIAPGSKITVKASVTPIGDPGAFFADGLYVTTTDPVFPMREFRVSGKIK